MWKTRFSDSKRILYLSLALSCGAIVLGVWGLLRTVAWHTHMGSTVDFKNVTGGIGSIVTALAVLVGGYWTYFKFVRGRTYRPRLSVDMAGQWRTSGTLDLLHIRIRVTNIGASKVSLNQYGTGLRLSFLADEQGGAPDDAVWASVALGGDPRQARTFEILTEHDWIEPGETVSDDLLLNLGRAPSIAKLELALVWSLSRRKSEGFDERDIEVFARRIIPPDLAMIDKIDPDHP